MTELVSYTVAPGALAGVPQPTLSLGGGAVLRPWADADAPALRAAYADPAIQRWHVRALDSLDEAREMIVDWRAAWAEERRLEWAVADADGTLLGRLGLKSLALFDGVATIAYWTVPAARGRGLAPRAVDAATRWAFGRGFRRLELEHSTLNAASCRVAEKAGFAPEGTRFGSALHADGHHDMHTHARLADAER
ncbi:GNAT family N-acetyltransferase [Promicromonospora sp. NPDC057138]|uniref:GNAT family N-acetyltransferase n=1 Tax=Promicromonospora sp. NPDC057138 TaxID=3346031 RepID=UPI00362B6D81